MYAAIRIRGSIGLSGEMHYVMKQLRLHRVNHLVLLPKNNGNKNSINKAKDYLTFGETDAATIAKVLEKRGRLPGNKRIGKEFLEKNKAESFLALAEEIIAGKKTLLGMGMKPVFRLSPPKKGFERAGIKKSYKVGGVLGYRASDINKLILKMI